MFWIREYLAHFYKSANNEYEGAKKMFAKKSNDLVKITDHFWKISSNNWRLTQSLFVMVYDN